MTAVGFIGLGLMGEPMARNLVRAGHRLTVQNRSRGAVDRLSAEGAAPAASPAEVGAHSEVIFTMLPGPDEVEQVVLGPGGLAESMRPGSLLIDCTTSAPGLARKVAEVLRQRGCGALDAPVSGGEVGAREATLSIMVGGTEGDFERALPLLRVLGKNINRLGEAGAGQVAKAANQIMVAMNLLGVAEALTFAQASGVEPAALRKALMGGFAHSRVLELHGLRMVERTFQPGGRIRSHLKDLLIALRETESLPVRLHGTALVRDLMRAMAEAGMDDLDQSGLLRGVEERLLPE